MLDEQAADEESRLRGIIAMLEARVEDVTLVCLDGVDDQLLSGVVVFEELVRKDELEDLILALSDFSVDAHVSVLALPSPVEDRGTGPTLKEEITVLVDAALVEMKTYSLQILKANFTEMVCESVALFANMSAARFKDYVDTVGGSIVERMSALSASVGAAGARIAALEL